MTWASNNETPGTLGDQGSPPPQADVIQPDQGTRRVAVLRMARRLAAPLPKKDIAAPAAAAAFGPSTPGPTRPTWARWPRMP